MYVEAIAEAIPLPDNTFDMVFCLFSFRDFKDKKQGLQEIFRVLKPGGQLVICDAGKANKLHGIFGVLWMNSVVQIMARIITGEKTTLGKDSQRVTLIMAQMVTIAR